MFFKFNITDGTELSLLTRAVANELRATSDDVGYHDDFPNRTSIEHKVEIMRSAYKMVKRLQDDFYQDAECKTLKAAVIYAMPELVKHGVVER